MREDVCVKFVIFFPRVMRRLLCKISMSLNVLDGVLKVIFKIEFWVRFF